ncbi:uncharacterized protein PV06_05170 [Exophiala oligosperma]|uniref:O-methyltransferase n=1 Tax=Exophiala oligosperma TaxID=215243 RepID=A0A0D2C2Y8_9EURO|nr:uncharacterized protein PV06_05170 [Exophiala oligosperma]KIW44137.1 hypothetical protein PV06_05170 [Exophiala oligosperma]
MESVLDFNNFHSAATVEDRAKSALLRPNPRLERALTNSAAKGIPAISVLPLAGQHLSIVARLMGAQSVLEIGTLGGYSAICFAGAGADVRVTSVEADPKHRDVALENVEGLGNVEVVLGDAEEVMARFVREGRRFDLVFIDADLDRQWEEFDLAVKLTRRGGCVWLDDVVASMFKNGQVGREEQDPTTESVLTKVGKDDRVKATLVPTVVCHPAMSANPVFNGFILATVL